METPEEVNLIAAARLIMRELESNKKLSNEAIRVLEDLGARLASMAKITETKDENEELSDIKLQINSIHDKVMIWDSGTDEYKEYLKAVDEIRTLIGRLESLNPSENSEEHDELFRKASYVLHTSMARVEEEFKHMLVHNRQNFEPAEDDGLDDSSVFSFVDDSADDGICRGSEVHIMDLINPQIIPDLKTIASLMFDSNYNKECSEAFISVRKEALDDCLSILVVELTSIENIMKMEWATLNSKIKKWTKALKIFVRVYLASEKFLCEQIFGKNESITSFCFSESSKASIFQLLNFAEAVAVGPNQPEKLPRILDMYEVLVDVKPDMESFYPDDNGLYLRTEFHDVVTRLGDCVTSTFLEFKDAVESNASNAAFPRGGVHHLTRYVMNYIITLIEYSNSLNYLLKDHGEDQDQDQDSSPMGLHFRSLMSILESNLKEKSRLYKEEALRHLFLMNNIQFMAEKVKGSELRTVLGDNWIRQCNSKVQQYAMSYERSTRSKSAQKEVTLCNDIGVLLNYDLVIQATGNFNTSNIIGNATFGATYKAEISPGVLVAIKRLRTGRFKGVQEFDAEIKILGRVRHMNLVTLIGYHASETEMFLIYNYLHGGNLERFIQERSMRAVDWRILHKIALDVARALAYLHDQCVPRVLHRDVKPSNILLDDDCNAYLSGFRLARLLGTSETHATTGVAGTFGYVAPEYAMMCRVSDKADVYSYGVVLLELLSDKKVLDPSFSCYENGFNIVSWASMMLKEGRAKEFFTAGLWDAGPHDDLVEVLHLSMVCTVDSFSTRPTMKQVVRRLKQLQPPAC